MERWWYAVLLIAGLLGCPVPPPGPSPSPSPTATPDPTPTIEPPSPSPPPATCVPHSEDPRWGDPIPPGERNTDLYPEYKKVIIIVGNTCGAKADESLERIAAVWREHYGRCAALWADAVAVRADDGLYEEWHAIFWGNGCTIPGIGAYKGAWPYGIEATDVR